MCAQTTFTSYQNLVVANAPCSSNNPNVCTGTILPLPFTTAFVRPIGQANHAVSVTLTDAPAHTCTGGALDTGLEGSFDNVIYNRIGDQSSSIGLNADGHYNLLLNAYAAFPYIKYVIRNFDTTNCVLTASYSGVVAGQATISLTNPNVVVTNIPSVNINTNYSSGLVAVPTSLTVLTATSTRLYEIWCNNTTASSINLTITNTAGDEYVGGSTPYPFPASANGFILNTAVGLPNTGIKWQAGGVGLKCQIVGLQ